MEDCNGLVYEKGKDGKNSINNFMNIDTIEKLSTEIAENHAIIIDDFVKTYIVSRWEDYFSKKKKIDFRRIELVEDRSEMPQKMVYYCRFKAGKLPKRSVSTVR
jgi:hypothetical protein